MKCNDYKFFWHLFFCKLTRPFRTKNLQKKKLDTNFEAVKLFHVNITLSNLLVFFFSEKEIKKKKNEKKVKKGSPV